MPLEGADNSELSASMLGWIRRYAAITEARHLWVLMVLACCPAILGAVVLELASQSGMHPRIAPKLNENHGADIFIFYAASSLAHLIICASAVATWRKEASRRRSDATHRVLRVVRGAIFSAMTLVLVSVSYSGLNINYLSHIRIYDVIGKSDLLGWAFACLPTEAYCAIYGFSAFPITLILAGFLAVVYASQAISLEISDLHRINPETEWPIEVYSIGQRIKRDIGVLSAVLVTSTAATALYLLMPSDLLAGAERNAFRNTSYATSVYWGTVFTLTLIALAAYAIISFSRRVDWLLAQSSLANPTARPQWIGMSPQLSLSAGVNMVATLVMPAATGLLSGLLVEA